MSRLILTTVDLTSNKFFARDLLNTWMASGSRYGMRSRIRQFLHMYVGQSSIDAELLILLVLAAPLSVIFGCSPSI